MRYTFQKSKIWEAGDPVDPSSDPVTIKVRPGKDEHTDRKRLPSAGLGRVWVLVDKS